VTKSNRLFIDTLRYFRLVLTWFFISKKKGMSDYSRIVIVLDGAISRYTNASFNIRDRVDAIEVNDILLPRQTLTGRLCK